MSTSTELNVSIRRVLLGDLSEDESVAALQGCLATEGIGDLLQGVPAVLGSAARSEVGRAIDTFLDVDAFDAAALGWRKHRLLTDAARRTLASPGSREVVQLASHRITSSYKPRIDVFLDDVRLGQVDLALTLITDVAGMQGVVAGGRLVALESGQLDLTASLTCQGITLAEGTSRIDLASEVSLGDGLPLIDNPDTGL